MRYQLETEARLQSLLKYDAKLDLTSGRLLWHQTNKNLARSGGPIDDNEKILISGKSDFVRALSLDSGTELWRIEAPSKSAT